MGTLRVTMKPFRFFDLPAEIRTRIYELLLHVGKPIQLEWANKKNIAPLFPIFFASRQLYEEAYRVFYRTNIFRIFSTDAKFFQAKYPLLVHFPRTYRAVLTTFELRLGPGWTSPPKRWIITPRFGLKDCKAVRLLKIFVELDPTSSMITAQYLKHLSLYTDFSVVLTGILLEALPSIREVEFDAYPSVHQDGDLMVALVAQTKKYRKRIRYGPLRGWSHETLRALELSKLEKELSGMVLSDSSQLLTPLEVS